MSYEQIQLIDKTAQEVRHTLANLLVTTGFALEQFGALSPEIKGKFVQQWETLYVKAMHDLQASFALLSGE
jgi:hypothetical protein